MKPGILFTLHQQAIAVVSDRLELRTVGQERFFPLYSGEFISPMHEVEVKTVPIHHIKKIQYPLKERPLEGQPDRYIQDYYVAMEPALREILETPIRAKLDQMLTQLKEDYQKEREMLKEDFGKRLFQKNLTISEYKGASLLERIRNLLDL